MVKIAEVAEDGSRGRRDEGQRQTETKALHAQFARDTWEVVADSRWRRVYNHRHEHVQYLQQQSLSFWQLSFTLRQFNYLFKLLDIGIRHIATATGRQIRQLTYLLYVTLLRFA